MYRLGIDVGGTFTDFTIFDAERELVTFYKRASTPHDPSEAILLGIEALIGLGAIEPDSLLSVGHGTTVATNMAIERAGARTGLLTTRGMRDVLEIGRQVRPHLYDLSVQKPPPLVRRAYRMEVDERMDATGAVVQPVVEHDVAEIVERLRAAEVQSVAIVLLHAYRNPAHEQLLAHRVRTQLPGVYVSVSSEVSPEFREYERASTTVLNAYVGPRVGRYIDRFSEGLTELGVSAAPMTFHSNGGLMSSDQVRRFPVRTCLSGPAAGVVGASRIAEAIDARSVITFDVGGTSTDVALIDDFEPITERERSVAGYPVRAPTIDVHVIGAGGGSIATLDEAGLLKVGPLSAGAVPGPVAYGLGGCEATLTDANIVLGRLNPQRLLGGEMTLDAEAAARALDEQIAQPLAISIEEAAQGVIAVAVANIARAIRSVSTERGYDPSAFALMAYGGAGPVHAVDVAIEAGCDTVIVPEEPGTLCARGILLADLSVDMVKTLNTPANAQGWCLALDATEALRDQAKQWFDAESVPEPARALEWRIDARYRGQSFEIPVELDNEDVAGARHVGDSGAQWFRRRFDDAHQQYYGYGIPGRMVELVNLRLRAIGIVPKAPLSARDLEPEASTTNPDGGAASSRRVYFGGDSGWLETPVLARRDVAIGEPSSGPLIVEEMSSTTLVYPGQQIVRDSYENLIISLGSG